MEAISETDRFAMAGSIDSFREHFDPFFALAVHLTAPAEVRVAIAHQREYEEFGKRALEGGDIHEAHQRFPDDVAGYDDGGSSASLAVHTIWAESLQRPVLRLDGSEEPLNNLSDIAEKIYDGLRPIIIRLQEAYILYQSRLLLS